MTPNITIRSYTTDQYYLDKIFYSNFYRLKKQEAPNNKVVVDIGAHCGFFSLTTMSAGYSKCYAFEPLLDNYRTLLKNTEVFSDSIPSYQAAAFHQNSFLRLLKPELNGDQFLDYGNVKQGESGEKVISLSISNILLGVVSEAIVDLLKVNTGYAFDFVTGNEQGLQIVKNICFELPFSPDELAHVKEKLVALGFANSMVIELKEKDQSFGFLGFFSKNNLDELFDIEDLKTKNYETGN